MSKSFSVLNTTYKYYLTVYYHSFFCKSILFGFIFPFTSFFTAFSQDTLNTIKQKIQNFDLAADKRILFDGKAKTCNISIKDRNKLYQILLDSNYKLIGQYTEKRDWIAATTNYENLEPTIQSKKNVLFSPPFNLVNHLPTENDLEFIDIFLRNDTKAYYFQKNSFAKKNSDFLGNWIARKKETILYNFKEKNNFFWITFSTVENEYTLYKINADLLVESTSLKFITQYNKTKNLLEIVKADTSINAFSNHNSSAKIKLYFVDDIIYITDNSAKEKSTIVHSLKINNLSYLRTKVYTLTDDASDILKSNSYIFQNKLIQAVLTEKKFYITVQDIGSLNTIAKYTIDKPNNKSTPDSIQAKLFERVGLYDDIIDVSNSKNIWEEERGENLFVHAFKVNDSLQITAGISTVEKDLITPIISTAISYFLFYNLFSDVGFLLGVRISPADKLTSLYYKFNLIDDTLVNSNYSNKFIIPFSKAENKFISKNKSSVVSIILKNEDRVYICYSKKNDSFSFIQFKTQ